jgi:hypothetical protein
MSQEYEPIVMDINVSDANAWSGEERPLLPVGRYKFRIVNVKQGKAAGQLEFKFEVVDGECAGQFAWNNYNYGHEVGLGRLKHVMQECGASLTQFNSDELVGQYIYADVVHNQGKERPDAMGQPMKTKIFANLVNERNANAEEQERDGDQGQPEPQPEPDPPPPPVTRQPDPPAPSTSNNRRQGARRT